MSKYIHALGVFSRLFGALGRVSRDGWQNKGARFLGVGG